MTFEKSHRKHYAVCSTMAKDYKKLLYQMHQDKIDITKPSAVDNAARLYQFEAWG